MDLLPEPVAIQPGSVEEPAQVLPRVRLYMQDRLRTAANIFGVWREYLYRPSYNPESVVPMEDLRLVHPTTIGSETEDSDSPEEPELSVHANKTTQLIMEWANTGAPTKSNTEVNPCPQVCSPPRFQA